MRLPDLSGLSIGVKQKRPHPVDPCAILAVSRMRMADTKKPVLFVEESFVAEPHRGHGVARCLMKAALDGVPGDTVVGLVVRSDAAQQASARYLYRMKFGMRQRLPPELERVGKGGEYEKFTPDVTLRNNPKFKNSDNDRQLLTYFMSATADTMKDMLQSHNCSSIEHEGPMNSTEFLSNETYTQLIDEADRSHKYQGVDDDGNKVDGDSENVLEIIRESDAVYVGYHIV